MTLATRDDSAGEVCSLCSWRSSICPAKRFRGLPTFQRRGQSPWIFKEQYTATPAELGWYTWLKVGWNLATSRLQHVLHRNVEDLVKSSAHCAYDGVPFQNVEAPKRYTTDSKISMTATFSLFSSIFGFIVAAISFLAFVVNICRSHLPSNKIRILESLLDETEACFRKAIEDGLLTEPSFVLRTERGLDM